MRHKVIVLHSYYGCDTGCCGHVVELPDGTQIGELEFTASDGETEEERRAWAIEFARKKIVAEHGAGHTVDLDWENSDIRSRVSC